MGKRSAGCGMLVFVCASSAWALGPTSTDWRDAAGSCGPADTKCSAPLWTPVRLNAVHGRSRANGGTVVTTKDIWAVGDNGNIIYYNGANWIQQSSPTTEKLRAVFIYPTNVTLGADQVAGWAAGDHGTMLRLTENSPGNYVWVCENCPGDCGPPATPGGGGGFNLCSTIYDIFPSDPNDVNSPIFFTGEPQCQWYADNTCFSSFGDAMTLYYFRPGMSGWVEARGNTFCPLPPAPFYISDASWIGVYRCTTAVNFTGVISQVSGGTATGGGVFDSGSLRYGVALDPAVGGAWTPFGSRFTTGGVCGYEPAFYTSAVFGNWAVIMGDAAGACWNHPSITGGSIPATNMLVYRYSPSYCVFGVNSGLSAGMDATWGVVRKLASLPAWGFGVGVGHGASGGADGAMDRAGTAPDAYFALVKWTDNNKLVKPDDPTSPNEVIYQQEPACASSSWPGLNGVFISAYNEAWAVGESGKILHWTGPIVTPAKLECSLSVSPTGSIPTGSWFDVVLTVTNSGEAGLANLAFGLAITPPIGVELMCGPFTSTVWFDGTNCGYLTFNPVAASLPPGGPAYFTWTFSMSGCGTGLSFTATVGGKDLLMNTNVSASTQYVIGAQPLALSVSAWHTPGAVTPGANITFAVVVTNTSATTALNPLIVDTLPPGLISVILDGPFGFTSGAVGGTVYWDGTGTMTIPPGVSYTFSATGKFAAPCVATPLSNRGWARADDGCGTLVQKLSGLDNFTLPGLTAPSLAVTVTHSPVAPPPGSDVVYTITVQNTGTATVTSLQVVDTMPLGLANMVTAPPPGFGFLTTWVGTATVFIWGAPVLALSPASSIEITVTAYVPSTCFGGSASNRAWAGGGTSCTFVQAASPFDSFPVTSLLQPVYTVAVTHAPATPGVGDPVVYSIVVTNTGGATITDLLVVDTMPATLAGPAENSTPAPFAFSSAGRVFSWSATGLSFFPATAVTFSASGYVSSGCAGAGLANSAWARTMSMCGAVQLLSAPDSFPVPGQLDGAIAVEAQQEIPGRYLLTITLTITNTGSSWINNILPSADLIISPASPETVKVGGPTPASFTNSLARPGQCTIINPCATSFRWTYRSSTITPVTITAAATAEICPPFTVSTTGCVAQGGSVCTFTASTVTFFNDSGLPGEFTLDRNLFRGRTETLTITFMLPETTRVTVRVYNSVGQRVRILYDNVAARLMVQSLTWNGTNDEGERVASGVYFIRLETPHWVKTKKVALVK